MPKLVSLTVSCSEKYRRWCRIGALVWISALCLAMPSVAQDERTAEGILDFPDFVIDLTSVPVADHPPPGVTRTGENLHGLNQAIGLPIECVSDPNQPWCPVLTIGTRGGVWGVDLKLFYADELGLGVISTQYTSPPGCLDLGCAIATQGDMKRALDTGYLEPWDQSEPFAIANTGVMEYTDITIDNNPDGELLWVTHGCVRPFDFGMRESLPVFDPPSNRRRDVYRPPFGSFSGMFSSSFSIHGNEPNLVAGGTDGVRLARLRTRGVDFDNEPAWRISCPVWGSVFDPGLATSTIGSSYHWDVVETGLGNIAWRDTIAAGSNYCGLPNYTSGYAGAVCVISEGLNGGFDTTLTSPRSINLSGLVAASLRFRLNFQRRFEEVVTVDLSRDAGATWETLHTIDQSVGAFMAEGGEEIEVPLTSFVGEPDVRLRFRYWDPTVNAANEGYYAQIDDVLIYEPDVLTFLYRDGFESGDTVAWSSSEP